MSNGLDGNGDKLKLAVEIATLRTELNTSVITQLKNLTSGQHEIDSKVDEIIQRLVTVETKVDERTSLRRSNTAIWVAVLAGAFGLTSTIITLFGAGM